MTSRAAPWNAAVSVSVAPERSARTTVRRNCTRFCESAGRLDRSLERPVRAAAGIYSSWPVQTFEAGV